MANLSDVEDTLVNIVSTILYPNGNFNPSIVPSVENIYIYAGWPRPDDLEKDIIANNAHVTIFPSNNGRNTTRFRENWIEKSRNIATLTTTIFENTVTIGGEVSVPQAVMVIVNKIAYAYQVQENDSLESIAQSLANLIPNAIANNNVITISNFYSLTARVIVTGEAVKETKRQEVIFNIIVWAPSRQNRTFVSNPIEIHLGALKRFVLPVDNYYAPILYMGLKDHDEFQKTYALYRRDLIFQVEYPTLYVEKFPIIAHPYANISLVNDIN